MSEQTEFRAPWPFIQHGDEYAGPRWSAGVVSAHGGGEPYCSDLGEVVLEIISTHKPGPRYLERVFFRSHLIAPDGTKTKKRFFVETRPRFEKLCKGWEPEYIEARENEA